LFANGPQKVNCKQSNNDSRIIILSSEAKQLLSQLKLDGWVTQLWPQCLLRQSRCQCDNNIIHSGTLWTTCNSETVEMHEIQKLQTKANVNEGTQFMYKCNKPSARRQNVSQKYHL